MLSPFHFDFYLLSGVFYLPAKMTWIGPRGVPRHLPFVTKAKELDHSCWRNSPQRFFLFQGPVPKMHQALQGGRALRSGPVPSPAEPQLPGKDQWRPHGSPHLHRWAGWRPLVALLEQGSGSQSKAWHCGFTHVGCGEQIGSAKDPWGPERR